MIDFILNPINADVFFKDYYEKKHLHIKRNQPNYYRSILTYKEIDELLFSSCLYHPEHRVIDNSLDSFPDPRTYTIANTKKIDPLKFSRSYTEGSTLVFSGAHERLYNLRKLSLEMETYFKHAFQTNIYLTPKNSQGFSPHYDTHDVFILQFEGEKKWRIYEKDILLADKTIPHDKENATIGKVMYEFTLKQGDMLYIPRGLVHDAYCDEMSSGHITLGLLGKTWAELIANNLIKNSKNFTTLRKYPPFHLNQSSNLDTEELQTICNNIINDILTSNEIQDDFYSKQKSISKGQLLQVINLDTINENTEIKISDLKRCRIEKTDENISIKFFDVNVTFPIYCLGFIEKLIHTNTYQSIKTIDSELDEESKIVLCKELSKNGIISIKNHT